MAVVTGRMRAVGLSVLLLAVTAAARGVDLREWAGDIKGDESTYIAMALSVAHDADLHYEPEDYQRFIQYYPNGPGGIFLKRRYELGFDSKTPVPADQSLAYGKAFVYPLAAAPFVFVGGPVGLVIFNWVLFGICLWCGVVFCRAAVGPRAGPWLAVAFFGASIAPVYLAWATPEVFNLALITVAYFLWLYKRVAPATAPAWLRWEGTTLIAAALIGVATFSKATHAGLLFPLLGDAVLAWQVRRTFLIGTVCVAVTAGLFGANALMTGDANYQGAPDDRSRRSFANTFPFDARGTSFDTTGSAMVTNDADTDRVLADELLAQLPVNAWYFLVGRHAGLVPYYFPGVLLGVVWLWRARRAPRWQWMVALGVLSSIGALLVLLPDSWNGGGGPPGNRYFLSLYPPLLFLCGKRGGAVTAGGALIGLLFVGPLVAHPYETSRAPWLGVERAPLNRLPIELTIVNDLPCRLNQLRCPLLWPSVPAEPSVQFYYMDGRTFSAEPQGTWIAGETTTDIIVKTDLPPTRVRLEFTAPVGNRVSGRFADRTFSATVPAGGRVAVTIANPDPFRYHQNSVYVWHVRTENGFYPRDLEPDSTDPRYLGVFVKPVFEYGATAAGPER